MYVRQVKQFLRAVDPSFDERNFGFQSLNDLLRACQRDGLFRMERDRQGVMRFFQGNVMKPVETEPIGDPAESQDMRAEEAVSDFQEQEADTPARDAEVVDGDVVQELEAPAVVDGEEAVAAEPEASEPQPAEEERPRRRRPSKAAGSRAPREKKPARSRGSRKKATPQPEA
jgi:hypothetical protein